MRCSHGYGRAHLLGSEVVDLLIGEGAPVHFCCLPPGGQPKKHGN